MIGIDDGRFDPIEPDASLSKGHELRKYNDRLPHAFKVYCSREDIAPDVAILSWEKSEEFRKFLEDRLSQGVRQTIGTPEVKTFVSILETLLGIGILQQIKGVKK